jgi:arsenate reductase
MMLVLGLQGSPRKKGNSEFLLNAFLHQTEIFGAKTRTIVVDQQDIRPCKEYTLCEKKGVCPIKDDMDEHVYPLLRQADLVLIASPVFFYGVTAQLKALIDRCQTLWARKYRLKLKDPGSRIRRGFLLAVGASGGKRLFDGLELTAKIFCDAISAQYMGSLTYSHIEGRGDMAHHPTVNADITQAAAKVMAPLNDRKRVLFVGRRHDCRSQMATALTRFEAGSRLDADGAGTDPASELNPLMVNVMGERGIDMGFILPQPLTKVQSSGQPEMVVLMDRNLTGLDIPGAQCIHWDLPDPTVLSLAEMRKMSKDIEKRVKRLAQKVSTGGVSMAPSI